MKKSRKKINIETVQSAITHISPLEMKRWREVKRFEARLIETTNVDIIII